MENDMNENMRRIGAQMANVLFNLCQNGDISAHTRDTMRELQRQWDDAVSATPAPLTISVGLPQDVINLVIAAREFWEQAMDESDESAALDAALEAFSSRVPYANEPDALEDQP